MYKKYMNLCWLKFYYMYHVFWNLYTSHVWQFFSLGLLLNQIRFSIEKCGTFILSHLIDYEWIQQGIVAVTLACKYFIEGFVHISYAIINLLSTLG